MIFRHLPRLGQAEERVLGLPGGWRFLPKPGLPTHRYAAVALLTKLNASVTGYCWLFGE
jgi:hypothetical protein